MQSKRGARLQGSLRSKQLGIYPSEGRNAIPIAGQLAVQVASWPTIGRSDNLHVVHAGRLQSFASLCGRVAISKCESSRGHKMGSLQPIAVRATERLGSLHRVRANELSVSAQKVLQLFADQFVGHGAIFIENMICPRHHKAPPGPMTGTESS